MHTRLVPAAALCRLTADPPPHEPLPTRNEALYDAISYDCSSPAARYPIHSAEPVPDQSYLGTKAPHVDAGRDSSAALVRRCGIDPQPVLRSPESTSGGPAHGRRIHSQAA